MVADALAPARYLGPDTPPLQVQWGDRDVITPTRCVDWFGSATPHAEIHMFRGVGHLPMLETPGRSAAALEGFVRRHGQ
jgi:pimeloyl-ACP methyl ester carboxylesterase